MEAWLNPADTQARDLSWPDCPASTRLGWLSDHSSRHLPRPHLDHGRAEGGTLYRSAYLKPLVDEGSILFSSTCPRRVRIIALRHRPQTDAVRRNGPEVHGVPAVRHHDLGDHRRGAVRDTDRRRDPRRIVRHHRADIIRDELLDWSTCFCWQVGEREGGDYNVSVN